MAVEKTARALSRDRRKERRRMKQAPISSVYCGIHFNPEDARCFEHLRRRVESANQELSATVPTPGKVQVALIAQGYTPDRAFEATVAFLRPQLKLLSLQRWGLRWNRSHPDDQLQLPCSLKLSFLAQGLTDGDATEAAITVAAAWQHSKVA